MRELLIDIGNQRLKWTFRDNKIMQASIALEHKNRPLAALLKKTWLETEKPDCVFLSSVADDVRAEGVKHIVNQLWGGVPLIVAESLAQGYGVRSAYQHPEKLGVDRWLALLAARHHYELPIVVVDCGTAITIDLLDESGTHRGGLISPGLGMMQDMLHQGAAALPAVSGEYALGPANDTEAGIYNGALFSAAGLIEKIITEFSESERVLMTGGDAVKIDGILTKETIINVDLVLQGLSVMADRQ